jgi:hypothetical protein
VTDKFHTFAKQQVRHFVETYVAPVRFALYRASQVCGNPDRRLFLVHVFLPKGGV